MQDNGIASVGKRNSAVEETVAPWRDLRLESLASHGKIKMPRLRIGECRLRYLSVFQRRARDLRGWRGQLRPEYRNRVKLLDAGNGILRMNRIESRKHTPRFCPCRSRERPCLARRNRHFSRRRSRDVPIVVQPNPERASHSRRTLVLNLDFDRERLRRVALDHLKPFSFHAFVEADDPHGYAAALRRRRQVGERRQRERGETQRRQAVVPHRHSSKTRRQRMSAWSESVGSTSVSSCEMRIPLTKMLSIVRSGFLAGHVLIVPQCAPEYPASRNAS